MAAGLPCERQPTTTAITASAARSTPALIMSETPRPLTTADGAIGMERRRSVTPRSRSMTTMIAVFMKPKDIVIANMPGIAKVA